MKALTLHRPFDHAILHGGKNCENRSRPPPEWLCGHTIAIHAGQRYRLIETWPVGYVPPDAEHLPAQAITGVARLLGALDLRGPRARLILPPASGGIALGISRAEIAARLERLEESPWWLGPVGWLLSEQLPIAEPIPCRGAQGLWTVPDGIARLLGERTLAARKARLARENGEQHV